MDMLWGSGEPTSALPDTDGVFFDDHQYVKYATSANTRADLLAFSCADDRTAQADSPVVVGEWSLSVNGDNEVAELSTKASDASGFYLKVASAQMQAYEKGAGWICESRAIRQAACTDKTTKPDSLVVEDGAE